PPSPPPATPPPFTPGPLSAAARDCSGTRYPSTSSPPSPPAWSPPPYTRTSERSSRLRPPSTPASSASACPPDLPDPSRKELTREETHQRTRRGAGRCTGRGSCR